ncbi:MAG TPA: cupin domain-containing protein [Anaerolineales bacterium]|nr:cupin domain-containing protein [Anaerolineales bacterium]
MDTLDFEPTLKTRAIVVKSAVDKQHDTVIMIAEIGPGESGPPSHIHPSQQETYEVLEGEAEFVLGNKTVLVKQGDKVEIPANTPHTFRNTTNAWLRMQDTHLPALTFEEMMRELHGLVHSGKIKGFNDFKSLVYLSMLWVKHKELQRSANPPFFVMQMMAFVGRLMGYRL